MKKILLNGETLIEFVLSLAKFVVFAITGSPVILGEAIRSLVDAVNITVLGIGIERSKRSPTMMHQFGYANLAHVHGTYYAFVC